MVTVVKRTKEETESAKKAKAEAKKNTKNLENLTNLAKVNFPFNIDIYPIGTGGFAAANHSLADPMFNVKLKDNLIVLSKEKYYDSTLKLAEAYEELTGKNWTLKKDYNE